MTETDIAPNELCHQKRRVSSRRWLLALFTLLLLLILGWLGWEQWRFVQRQAAAPVVSVADDGRVYINGAELVIGPDGLPPKVLEEIGGGPPVEIEHFLTLPESQRAALTSMGYLWRCWQYPRLGLTLQITRGLTPDGACGYQARMSFGTEQPATVVLFGQYWWLGPPGPFTRRPVHGDLAAFARPGELMLPCSGVCVVKAGGTEVQVHCPWRAPLSWLGSLRFSSHPLSQVSVATPWVGARIPSTWPPVYGEIRPRAAPASASAAASAPAAAKNRIILTPLR